MGPSVAPSGLRTVGPFLDWLRGELGHLPPDLHVSRMFSALVAVSGARVLGLTEPYLEYCPLAASLYPGRDASDPRGVVQGICDAVSVKARRFGHYGEGRELQTRRLAIPFGASEMMMRALQKGAVDAAVVACEGAGTVVTASPYLVQGIGARMNGLFYTSPIPGMIRRIEALGETVVSTAAARIDQCAGVEIAGIHGHRRIVVTVNAFQGESLQALRDTAAHHEADLVILGICTTGVDAARAAELSETADLVWACASPDVRRICGGAAWIQVTTRIPVFVMTDRGAKFLSAYATRPSAVLSLEAGVRYLISRRAEGPLVGFGKVPVRIAPQVVLPVLSDDSPRLSGCTQPFCRGEIASG